MEHLIRRPNTAIARFVPARLKEPEPDRDPLKILIVASSFTAHGSPRDKSKREHLERYVQTLKRKIDSIEAPAPRVTRVMIDRPITRVRERIRSFKPTVVHLIAHGFSGDECFSVVLRDETQATGREVSWSELRNALDFDTMQSTRTILWEVREPQLTATPLDLWFSAEMVRAYAVPAVVTVRRPSRDDVDKASSMRRYHEHFYKAVVSRRSVTFAHGQGVRAMYDVKPVEAFIPRLTVAPSKTRVLVGNGLDVGIWFGWFRNFVRYSWTLPSISEFLSYAFEKTFAWRRESEKSLRDS